MEAENTNILTRTGQIHLGVNNAIKISLAPLKDINILAQTRVGV